MEIDKILLILEQIEVIGVNVKRVMADGKINLEDLDEAIAIITKAGDMIEAFKGGKEALEQAKDLDAVEGVEIVKKLYEIGQKIEQA